jgi:hypothetical protein
MISSLLTLSLFWVCSTHRKLSSCSHRESSCATSNAFSASSSLPSSRSISLRSSLRLHLIVTFLQSLRVFLWTIAEIYHYRRGMTL